MVDTKVVDTKLKNDKNIPNPLKENQIQISRNINKQDCDFLQSIQLCESTISKVVSNKLCIKNQSFLLNEENNEKEINNEMEDRIFLFADSILMNEYLFIFLIIV